MQGVYNESASALRVTRLRSRRGALFSRVRAAAEATKGKVLRTDRAPAREGNGRDLKIPVRAEASR